MKRILITILFALSVCFVRAQNNDKLTALLSKYLQVNSFEYVRNNEYKKAYIFPIAIQVDNNGLAKNVISSGNIQKDVKMYFDLNLFESQLKKDKTNFKNYAGNIVILPVLLKQEKVYYINDSVFDNFENFLPNLEPFKNYKKITLLKGINYNVFTEI